MLICIFIVGYLLKRVRLVAQNSIYSKKYFIHDGQQQIGPFSAAELIERGIASCTPVFTAGLGRYVIASEIPMLIEAFTNKLDGFKKATAVVSIKEIKRDNKPFSKKWDE